MKKVNRHFFALIMVVLSVLCSACSGKDSNSEIDDLERQKELIEELNNMDRTYLKLGKEGQEVVNDTTKGSMSDPYTTNDVVEIVACDVTGSDMATNTWFVQAPITINITNLKVEEQSSLGNENYKVIGVLYDLIIKDAESDEPIDISEYLSVMYFITNKGQQLNLDLYSNDITAQGTPKDKIKVLKGYTVNSCNLYCAHDYELQSVDEIEKIAFSFCNPEGIWKKVYVSLK